MIELIQETRTGLILSITNLLTLNEVGITGGAYAMRELNEEHLEALMQSDHTKWPPALVTRCPEGYILVGGYHRRETLKRKGIDEIRATCQAFSSDNEIVEAAFRDNLTHGLPASAETRSDYAYWLYLTFPEMSQTEIAERAGISQPSVSKAIARREKLALEEVGGQEEEAIDTVKVCRQFVRKAVKFVDAVENVDPTELFFVIREVIKSEKDRSKLIRLNSVLNALSSQQISSGSQFKTYKKATN